MTGGRMENKITGFRDLKVWQRAYDLSLDLSHVTIENFNQVNDKRHETVKMLQGLIKSLS
jgi:hypothetical protein